MTPAQHTAARARYGIPFHVALCCYLIELNCWRQSGRILKAGGDPFNDDKFMDCLRQQHDPDRQRARGWLAECRRLKG